MSLVTEELKDCMTNLVKKGDDLVTATFSFSKEFIGFKGHFPGQPVLPGICKIQAMVTMMSAYYGRKARLREITMAKFLSPVSCDEEIIAECQISANNGEEIKIKAILSKHNKKIAEFLLIVSLESKKQEKTK